MAKLDGKVAIITGGASGIGEATVRLFVQEGARVVVADIQDDPGKSLARELAPGALYLHADVSREPEVSNAVDEAVEKFGRLDCIFNNAGFGRVLGSIESFPLDEYESHMGVLVRGVFLGMKHAARVMKSQGSGSIINTGSVAGLHTGYGNHIYSAAKAAVIHLTRCVASELGADGIRVNCICPGPIVTNIFAHAFGISPDGYERTHAVLKNTLVNSNPLRRAGLPQDIAQAALWLASDDASFVNGHALVVDGGGTAGRMWSEFKEREAQLRAALNANTS